MLPFGIGFSEIVVIGIVMLLVVGPHKLPDLAKTVGKGLRVVRRAANEMRNAINVEEVQAVRRELTRPIHDWKHDDEPEDMELGPDGVLRPVRRNGPKPTPKSSAPATTPTARAADKATDKAADKPSISLGKSAQPAGPDLAKGPQAAPAGAPEIESDDDEADPDAHAPAASVARHDPLFDRIKTEIERTAAKVEATAGHAEDEVLISRNAPVPRDPQPAPVPGDSQPAPVPGDSQPAHVPGDSKAADASAVDVDGPHKPA
jgi:Tat protein translocase TatB subunit